MQICTGDPTNKLSSHDYRHINLGQIVGEEEIMKEI
jgi:hypothetical protein